MSPTIRDEVLLAWRTHLINAGAPRDTVDALVNELEQLAISRGARLPRTVRPDDPNAVALAPLPEPGNTAAGAARARAELQAARERNTPPETTADPLPPIPTPEET